MRVFCETADLVESSRTTRDNPPCRIQVTDYSASKALRRLRQTSHICMSPGLAV